MVHIPDFDVEPRPDEDPTSQARRSFVNHSFHRFASTGNDLKVYGITPLNFLDNYALMLVLAGLFGFLLIK